MNFKRSLGRSCQIVMGCLKNRGRKGEIKEEIIRALSPWVRGLKSGEHGCSIGSIKKNSLEEIIAGIMKVMVGKAPGRDGILPEAVRTLH